MAELDKLTPPGKLSPSALRALELSDRFMDIRPQESFLSLKALAGLPVNLDDKLRTKPIGKQR
jgi:hypothetical protein